LDFDSLQHMTEQILQLTEKAAQRVKSILNQQSHPDWGLRIKVQGGGCAGYSYKMDVEEKPQSQDQVLNFYGVSVFIDPKTALFIKGTEIDYVEELMQSGFRFKNPNSTGSCSCGESFSV